MKQRLLSIFCLILISAGATAAQRRSVTNADLEKFRRDRLKAETDYRENYARMGFPSPEELERRRDQSIKDLVRLSSSLRAQQLEADRIEAERYRAEAELAAAYFYANQPVQSSFEYQYPAYGYTYNGGGYQRGPKSRAPYQQPGYYAGGKFWPTGPSSPPKSLLVGRRR